MGSGKGGMGSGKGGKGQWEAQQPQPVQHAAAAAATTSGGLSPPPLALEGGLPVKGGEEYLRQKGKNISWQRWKGKSAGPQTQAQAKRMERVARGDFRWSVPEERSTDHQLEVPWPHSARDMGAEWMARWRQEAKDVGFSLRLSTWRHATWRDHPALAAGFYRLLLTGDEADPGCISKAVQLLTEMIADCQRRHVPVKLPWRHIISQWDGQERGLPV